MRPSLVLLAGPNGAGKTTLYETRVADSFAGPFINADLIQRDELLADGASFAAETVFSHPSKLEIIETARAKGYLVVVMHIGVDSPDLSVERVRGRTEDGGHNVSEDKIRARYERGQPLIRRAVLRADRGMVFDNSRLNTPLRRVLVFASGRPVEVAPILPRWILDAYGADLAI